MPYTIQVNGERRTVDVEAETPLLWVLRDELDLKGTKFGCGMALCGACTVHLDGVPTRACITPIAAVGAARAKVHGRCPLHSIYHGAPFSGLGLQLAAD